MATKALTKYTRLTRAERDLQLAEAGSTLRGAFANNFGLAIKHRKVLMSAIAAGLGRAGKLYGRKRVTPPAGVPWLSRESTCLRTCNAIPTTTMRWCISRFRAILR